MASLSQIVSPSQVAPPSDIAALSNMSSLSDSDRDERVRVAFAGLSQAVREMTPVGMKPIPIDALEQAGQQAASGEEHINHVPFNLLAHHYGPTCIFCNLPGHQSPSINNAPACRVATMSLLAFWENMAEHVLTLWRHSQPFQEALQASDPTYEMRSHGVPKGGSYVQIFVDRLTVAYLKYQGHMGAIMPKAKVYLPEQEMARVVEVTKSLNCLLLDGKTPALLFEEHVKKLDGVVPMDTSN